MAASLEPTPLTWTAALLAWILAIPLYRVMQFVGTVGHEGGHAAIATLLFHRVRSVRFRTDAGGATDVGKLPWLVDVAVTLAGYLGGSLFGLLFAWLLARDRVDAVIWGSFAFLAVMLLVVRGWVGWLLVPAVGAVLFLVATRVEAPLQALFAHVWVWFLLIVAVEDMIVYIDRRYYNDSGADTAVMQRLTLVPSELWSLALLVGTIAALVCGGVMLLRLA